MCIKEAGTFEWDICLSIPDLKKNTVVVSEQLIIMFKRKTEKIDFWIKWLNACVEYANQHWIIFLVLIWHLNLLMTCLV